MSAREIAPDVLTVDEVATILRRSKRTIQALAAREAIPGRKLGGEWVFRREEFWTWWETGGTKEEKPRSEKPRPAASGAARNSTRRSASTDASTEQLYRQAMLTTRQRRRKSGANRK